MVDSLASGANFLSYNDQDPALALRELSQNADLATDYKTQTIYYIDPDLKKVSFKLLGL
jgi:hypothetical protein